MLAVVAVLAAAPAAQAVKFKAGDVRNASGLSKAQRKAVDIVDAVGAQSKTVTATAGVDSVGGFAVDGSGRVIVSATNNDLAGHVRFSLARYANGILDAGFNGGVLITQVGSQDFAQAGGVAIQPSGKIIQVGGAFPGGNAGDEDMAMSATRATRTAGSIPPSAPAARRSSTSAA